MARTTVVTLTDDTDGSKADETVRLGLDGISYEVDLSSRNAAALRKAVEAYAAAARRVGTSSRSRRGSVAGTPARRNAEETQAIREWARASGYQVAERGRISAEVEAAYSAAPSA